MSRLIDIANIATREMNARNAAAERLVGTLYCTECNRTQECTREDLARYLRSGWPMCCEFAMILGPTLAGSNGGGKP